MASVTVFVDDAVRGDLPPVCVRTGLPANTKVTVDASVGGLGAVWLLVLAGPIGWLVLLGLLLAGKGRETLTVKLPYTGEAFARERARRNVRDATTLLALFALIAGAAHFMLAPMAWVMLAAALVAVACATHVLLDVQSPDIGLDASRRWVRLSNVHPTFAAAAERSLAPERRLPNG